MLNNPGRKVFTGHTMNKPRAPRDISAHPAHETAQPHNLIDGVFHVNIVRHAYYAVMSKWRETNLPEEDKKALMCVPEGIVGCLGEPQAMEFLTVFTAQNTPLMRKMRDDPDGIKPDPTWRQEQGLNRRTKEAAETVWTRLGKDLQAAITAQRDKTAPEAADADLKIAAYEFAREMFNRTYRGK
jgi:hypothetical protein